MASRPTTSQPAAALSRLLRYLAVHAAIGAISGVAVCAALIATNVGGLADLLATASEPVLPVALLAVFFALSLGSLAMGAAVMAMPREPQGGDGDGDRPGSGRSSAQRDSGNGSGSLTPVRAVAGRPGGGRSPPRSRR